MLATKNPCIQSAYEQLQVISQDDKKRMEYEAREKAIREPNEFCIPTRTNRVNFELFEESKNL